MADLQCKNCEEEIKKGWKRCPKCGADLELGKYSSSDDPVSKLQGDVNKIKKYLEDKAAEEDNGDKKKKRTPLFGD
jgi:transcription initiation factor IIE alpha subunit